MPESVAQARFASVLIMWLAGRKRSQSSAPTCDRGGAQRCQAGVVRAVHADVLHDQGDDMLDASASSSLRQVWQLWQAR